MLDTLNFRKKCSPHVYSLTWILNPLNIKGETAYIDIIENALNSQFPERENEPELFELVKTIHCLREPAWNITQMNFIFCVNDSLLIKQIIGKPLEAGIYIG